MKSGTGSDKSDANERQRIIRQINPHFIFNTLATIRIITKINADLAYDMIYDFSKYLRAVFQSLTNYENISFKEETDYVIAYVNLEKIRFGNNITFQTDINETDFMLPLFSIQPIVENAIIHGLMKGKRKGVISLSSFQTSSEYIVCVKDDGIGFDAEAYGRRNKDDELYPGGLENVRNRIEQMTGGSMDIKSTIGNGTVITLHIPKIFQEK